MAVQKKKPVKIPGFDYPARSPDEYAQKQREHMIAEAAYYLAEHRHFEGGDPLDDWLKAQAEIDSKM